MSNGESNSRKSLELLIQVSAWTGGILAAGVGGLLYAFISKETSPDVIPYFKWALIPLILALAATWWVQMHVATHARELELADSRTPSKEAAEKPPGTDDKRPGAKPGRQRNVNLSIMIQAAAQTAALVIIAVAVFLYDGRDPEPWSILASQSNELHTSYLMKVSTAKNGSEDERDVALRLLVSDTGGNWRTCSIDPAAVQETLQCPAGQPSPTGSPALQLMGKPILFHRLQYKLKYQLAGRAVDLTEAVCATKQAILNAGASGVFVVGSHDRAPVSDGAAVDSNESLAQLRASSVASFLSESNSCGPAVQSVISLNAAPVLATKEVSRGTDVSADRNVRVYGLVAKQAAP